MNDTVDLHFPVTSSQVVPVDHGYQLFAAVSRLVPVVHDNPTIGLDQLRGVPIGNGHLELVPNQSAVTIRVTAHLIPRLLPLAGAVLALGDKAIRLGAPRVSALTSAPAVWSRLVSINGYTQPVAFRQAVERQLGALGLSCSPDIQVGARRVLRVKAVVVVGFTVCLRDLTEEGSLAVQRQGVGGRRRFGCGFFHPGNAIGGG